MGRVEDILQLIDVAGYVLASRGMIGQGVARRGFFQTDLEGVSTMSIPLHPNAAKAFGDREDSQFPVNHNSEMGVDPAIERAWAAGEVAADGDEDWTQRTESEEDMSTIEKREPEAPDPATYGTILLDGEDKRRPVVCDVCKRWLHAWEHVAGGPIVVVPCGFCETAQNLSGMFYRDKQIRDAAALKLEHRGD